VAVCGSWSSSPALVLRLMCFFLKVRLQIMVVQY
jgi:hypothetical protein